MPEGESLSRAGSANVERLTPQSGDGGLHPTPAHQNITPLIKANYIVRDCPLKEAQAMVAAYHYSRGGSNTAVYTHGLYERATDRLIGVAWWLPPTRVCCESVNREEWKRVLSLTRLVCLPDVPKNSASFLLSKSVMLIRRDARFVSLVTYADESQGHTGAIYRAAGWKYVGRTGPYVKWVDPVSGRQVACKATVNRTKAEMEALGHVRVGAFYKHKFVMHLMAGVEKEAA